MIPLTTIGMLAADGWVYGVFAELRGQAVGGASKSVGLAFAIGCIIVALKMIRIAYDMMSDEQGGGMGSLRLSQILRPLVLLLAIQAAGTILSTFDGVVTGVTSGISHSYSSASVSLAFSKAVDAVESALGDTVGEDIVQRAKDIDDRPSITAEQVQDIMTSGMTGGAVFGTMISGWIQKRKDRNALDQEAAERLREQAGDDVAEAQDDGQGGILKNVKAIKVSLDEFLKLRRRGADIEDGSWRLSFRDGTIIPSIAVVVYNALFYVIECFAEITLCLLAMFFPWTLVISLVGPWERAYMDWAGRYIVVSFWKVAAVGVNYVVQMAMGATLKYQAMQALSSINGGAADAAVGKVAAGITVSAVIAVAGVFALLHVNDIASAIIPAGGGGGMGSMGSAAGSFAGNAAAMPGRAASGVKGLVQQNKGAAAQKATQAFQSNVSSALGKLTE